jgi:hypothetical protein
MLAAAYFSVTQREEVKGGSIPAVDRPPPGPEAVCGRGRGRGHTAGDRRAILARKPG